MAYISELNVSLNVSEEQFLQSQGFKKIGLDLNKGAGGNDIFLWYKKGSTPITRVQVTFNDGMSVGLSNAGYIKIHKDGSSTFGTSKGPGEFHTPIVDFDVTLDPGSVALKFSTGWEKSACDLNRKAGGNWIHTWVKREKQTYICDVTAAASYGSDPEFYREGYIRVDEDTNREAGGPDVFIWYRQTTDPRRALTDLNSSTNDEEYQSLQHQGYTPVNVNLNEGTGGHSVYMWYKKDSNANPIKAMSLVLIYNTVLAYERAGVSVIQRNLNVGTKGSAEFLCFYR